MIRRQSRIAEISSAAPATGADVDTADVFQVTYMGFLYPAAKRIGNLWYHETCDGYKPFALQGRVRRVIERQHPPR